MQRNNTTNGGSNNSSDRNSTTGNAAAVVEMTNWWGEGIFTRSNTNQDKLTKVVSNPIHTTDITTGNNPSVMFGGATPAVVQSIAKDDSDDEFV